MKFIICYKTNITYLTLKNNSIYIEISALRSNIIFQKHIIYLKLALLKKKKNYIKL